MIILHVLLALSAIGLSIFSFFSPKLNILKTSYTLAIATLASGTALIFLNGASVIRTCLTGMVFFAAVSILNELSRKKLAIEKIN